jgi:hypothetical protein
MSTQHFVMTPSMQRLASRDRITGDFLSDSPEFDERLSAMTFGDQRDFDIMQTTMENNDRIWHQGAQIRRAFIGVKLFALKHTPSHMICDTESGRVWVWFTSEEDGVAYIRTLGARAHLNYEVIPFPSARFSPAGLPINSR